MGVNYLWSVLEPVKEHLSLSSLRGQKLAVDLSIWICEFQGNKQIESNITNLFLRNLFFRVSNLLLIGIDLIFIIDGQAPDLKAEAMHKRQNERVLYGKSLRNNFHHCKSTKRSNLNATVKECCELLDCLGVPYLESQGEAEAYCAFLNKHGVVDACITNDGDAFLYGAKRVYRNFTMDQKDPHVESYNVQDIKQLLSLNQEKLVAFALLTGCDYQPKGVPHVGVETALKLLMALSDRDVLLRFRQWHSIKPSDICCGIEKSVWEKASKLTGFPSEQIIEEFLISKDVLPKTNLQWKSPNMKKFENFMIVKVKWTKDYAVQKVLPLLTRWIMLEMVGLGTTKTCGFYLTPVKILKNRVCKGVKSVEMEWKISGSSENETYVTIEDKEMVGQCFPDLLEQFSQDLKKNIKTKPVSRIRCKTKKTEPKENSSLTLSIKGLNLGPNKEIIQKSVEEDSEELPIKREQSTRMFACEQVLTTSFNEESVRNGLPSVCHLQNQERSYDTNVTNLRCNNTDSPESDISDDEYLPLKERIKNSCVQTKKHTPKKEMSKVLLLPSFTNSNKSETNSEIYTKGMNQILNCSSVSTCLSDQQTNTMSDGTSISEVIDLTGNSSCPEIGSSSNEDSDDSLYFPVSHKLLNRYQISYDFENFQSDQNFLLNFTQNPGDDSTKPNQWERLEELNRTTEFSDHSAEYFGNSQLTKTDEIAEEFFLLNINDEVEASNYSGIPSTATLQQCTDTGEGSFSTDATQLCTDTGKGSFSTDATQLCTDTGEGSFTTDATQLCTDTGEGSFSTDATQLCTDTQGSFSTDPTQLCTDTGEGSFTTDATQLCTDTGEGSFSTDATQLCTDMQWSFSTGAAQLCTDTVERSFNTDATQLCTDTVEGSPSTADKTLLCRDIGFPQIDVTQLYTNTLGVPSQIDASQPLTVNQSIHLQIKDGSKLLTKDTNFYSAGDFSFQNVQNLSKDNQCFSCSSNLNKSSNESIQHGDCNNTISNYSINRQDNISLKFNYSTSVNNNISDISNHSQTQEDSSVLFMNNKKSITEKPKCLPTSSESVMDKVDSSLSSKDSEPIVIEDDEGDNDNNIIDFVNNNSSADTTLNSSLLSSHCLNQTKMETAYQHFENLSESQSDITVSKTITAEFHGSKTAGDASFVHELPAFNNDPEEDLILYSSFEDHSSIMDAVYNLTSNSLHSFSESRVGNFELISSLLDNSSEFKLDSDSAKTSEDMLNTSIFNKATNSGYKNQMEIKYSCRKNSLSTLNKNSCLTPSPYTNSILKITPLESPNNDACFSNNTTVGSNEVSGAVLSSASFLPEDLRTRFNNELVFKSPKETNSTKLQSLNEGDISSLSCENIDNCPSQTLFEKADPSKYEEINYLSDFDDSFSPFDVTKTITPKLSNQNNPVKSCLDYINLSLNSSDNSKDTLENYKSSVKMKTDIGFKDNCNVDDSKLESKSNPESPLPLIMRLGKHFNSQRIKILKK